MRMALRFLVPLLLVLGGVAWAATPLLGELIERWLRADVEMRSQLVFDSVQDTVVRNARDPSNRRIDGLFESVTRDERLLAVGLCSPEGRLIHRSPTWPLALACPAGPSDLAAGTPAFKIDQLTDGTVLSAALALTAEGSRLGHLVIAGITVVVARVTLRGWVRAVRKGLAPTE
ncbi:MAG TPA: trehalose-6-phosphate synthase, partial [Chromatiaceae bacterium]|nr:trehalose-6-phosphate synthase [Chromatiaceae bacterium]